MKDILFEKYREILDKDIIEIEPYLFYAAVACANTTKEIAKGFAEWIEEKGWLINELGIWECIASSVESNPTTEQLLEKYLLTLNQE